jgi:thiaminase/transcriptional activator TenA
MSLSNQAWSLVESLVNKIERHPFNQSLGNGTLESSIFAYYIEQDSLYLQSFARVHSLIAARAELEDFILFLDFAKDALIFEQECVHHFFKAKLGLQPSGLQMPALIGYTSYLLKTAALDPVEIGVAAVLPCFWIYATIGERLLLMSSDENPYHQWIKTYTDPVFLASVHAIIAIFDRLGVAAPHLKNAMLSAFKLSVQWEFHFWDEAYRKIAFEAI